MSYCRSDGVESDVYLIGSFSHLECFGAGWELEAKKPVHQRAMVPDWDIVDGRLVKLPTSHETDISFYSTSRQEMVSHLMDHRSAGHRVPNHAIERLLAEIETEGDEYLRCIVEGEHG